MKTPEQMAEEYADCFAGERRKTIAKKSFFTGYEAAKETYKDAILAYEDVAKQMLEEAVRIMSPNDQLADADKVTCNTTIEEIKAVDTGDLMPVTNSSGIPDSWISVKERLPQRSQKVLALGKDHSVLVLKLRDSHGKDIFGNWEYVSGFDEDVNGCLVIDVTHWMPLPEPPKKDD